MTDDERLIAELLRGRTVGDALELSFAIRRWESTWQLSGAGVGRGPSGASDGRSRLNGGQRTADGSVGTGRCHPLRRSGGLRRRRGSLLISSRS
jgi:hypothetical protein